METKEVQCYKTTMLSGLDLLKEAKDPLVETAALRIIKDACEMRLEAIKDDAILNAEMILSDIGLTSGRFEHEGHRFELSRKPVYEFVEKPQRYTMSEGVEFRQYYNEQKALKEQTSALTKLMNALTKNFAAKHKTFEPDKIQKVLKVL